jgi:hypothetical protein
MGSNPTPLPSMGQAATIGKPYYRGIIDKLRSLYQANAPVGGVVDTTLGNLRALGGILGLDNPASAMGGPGLAMSGALGLKAEQMAPQIAGAAEEMAPKAEPFFSGLKKLAMEKLGPKVEGAQAINTLKKIAKSDEWAASKLEKALIPGVKYNKTDILQHIDENSPKLSDVILESHPYGHMSQTDWELAITRAEGRGDWDEVHRLTQAQEGLNAATGSGKGMAKFAEHVEPGGKNYKEMFVTAPPKKMEELPEGFELKGNPNARTPENAYMVTGPGPLSENRYAHGATPEDAMKTFQSYHGARQSPDYKLWKDGHGPYNDIENPIVRMRMNDRTGPNGEKILFLEEMQPPSKSNQEKMPPELIKRWREIGMKRAMTYAAENGYDKVAWTPGKMQADRYGLEKHIDEIFYNPQNKGFYAKDKIGRTIYDQVVEPEKLPEIVGEELAEKLMVKQKRTDYHLLPSDGEKGTGYEWMAVDNEGRPAHYFLDKKVADSWMNSAPNIIRGADLKVGGAGLKKVYDEDLPNVAKKLGATPETTRITFINGPSSDKEAFIKQQMRAWGQTREQAEAGWINNQNAFNKKVPSIDIKSMADKLKKGFAVFSVPATVAGISALEAKRLSEKSKGQAND